MLTKKRELPKLTAEKRRMYMAQVSHEIRTPMNAIVGISQILLRQVKDPEEREQLKAMDTASQSLLMTVNNILDYEGMIIGDITINDKEFELSSLIDEVSSIANINIGDSNVGFFVEADPNLPSVLKGDSTRIKQVLTLLFHNAEKFINEGYIAFKVSGEERDEVCDVSFTIEDTGRGFTDEDMEKMFNDYDNNGFPSLNDEYGVGIGLAIANSLVELMGSKLCLMSESGEGSSVSFTLSLPVVESKPESSIKNTDGLMAAVLMNDKKEEETICKALTNLSVPYIRLNNPGEIIVENEKSHISHVFINHEKYDQIKEVKELKELGLIFITVIDTVKQAVPGRNVEFIKRPVWCKDIIGAFNGEGFSLTGDYSKLKETIVVNNARVLLVDDNDINLKVTKGLLKPYGLIVDTADSGEAGIELIKKNIYDIVYMDHMMPGMDGIEATTIIRELDDPYYKSLPIVALSANTIEGMEEMFKMAGMNDFVAKPVTIKELEASLRKWLPKEKVTVGYMEVREAEADEAVFKNFKMIDTTIGLSYTNGNVEMYSAIVKDFATGVSEKKFFINELAALEDVGRFTIEVHALKSTAKTIGASRLSDRALELERLGHKRDINAIKEKLPLLNAELELVIEDLKPLIAVEEISIKKVPVDRERVREILRKLFYAADDFDYEKAKQIIAELGGFEYEQRMQSVYDGLLESIEDIDYEETRKGALLMLANI